MNTEYQAQQARKVQAREHKETDKKRAIENPETVRSINFDLPKGSADTSDEGVKPLLYP